MKNFITYFRDVLLALDAFCGIIILNVNWTKIRKDVVVCISADTQIHRGPAYTLQQ